MYKLFGKRTLDLIFALIGLIVASPILMVVYMILWVTNRGNPVFIQPRPGKNENVFYIIKFKTMTNEVDKDGQLLPDEKRLTKLGALIRKTSLDEIPQLINVLKGEMSFIGPRPLLIKYLPYYTKRERIRHLVRPGITGLAQVSGRNMLSWETKLEKDCEYAENYSLIMDFKIALKTIRNVLMAKDVVINPATQFAPLNIEREGRETVVEKGESN